MLGQQQHDLQAALLRLKGSLVLLDRGAVNHDAILAAAISHVFEEYVDEHGLAEISEIFAQGVRVEVGDLLPSSHYAELLKQVPPAWEKAFEVNAAEDHAVRASCVEFVLAGLWATDRISRGVRHGQVSYVV